MDLHVEALSRLFYKLHPLCDGVDVNFLVSMPERWYFFKKQSVSIS